MKLLNGLGQLTTLANASACAHLVNKSFSNGPIIHIVNLTVECEGVSLSVHDAKHLAQAVCLKELKPDNNFCEMEKMGGNDESWIETGVEEDEGGERECRGREKLRETENTIIISQADHSSTLIAWGLSSFQTTHWANNPLFGQPFNNSCPTVTKSRC